VFISDNEYTDTAYLNITVIDDNDNSPIFQHNQYTFLVPVSTAIGTSIGQVVAADVDIGIYGRMLFFRRCHPETNIYDTDLQQQLGNHEKKKFIHKMLPFPNDEITF
jgi:hypothetical protein